MLSSNDVSARSIVDGGYATTSAASSRSAGTPTSTSLARRNRRVPRETENTRGPRAPTRRGRSPSSTPSKTSTVLAGGLRGEEVEPEAPREVPGDELALDAVAGLVERRRERAEAPLAG